MHRERARGLRLSLESVRPFGMAVDQCIVGGRDLVLGRSDPLGNPRRSFDQFLFAIARFEKVAHRRNSRLR